MLPLPPPHQEPPRPTPPATLRLWLKDLRFSLSWPAMLGLAVIVALAPATVEVLTRPLAAPGPSPLPHPQVPLQVSTYAPLALAVTALGRLPPGVETQRKPPCDPDAEEAIGGWCWIPLDVEKCPVEKGKAFEHEGKCYLRALRAERPPTTGEPTRLPVAGSE